MPRNDQHREPKAHPQLSRDDDATQRGSTGPDAVGSTPEPPRTPDPDPAWTPDRSHLGEWNRQLGETGKEHRPHREDVYPYLLIRAFAPGDRGKRPTWPPIPCWESPDVLLIDAAYAGPFDQSRVAVSPVAGRSYRAFVRVFNLGLLPAVGVHVRAWYVNPGYFGPGNQGDPYYTPTLIGGAMVDLEDRTRPGCMKVVELDAPWVIPTTLTGHECLLASASCPADQWNGTLDANNDRHVGQRNVTILAGAQSLETMLLTLSDLVVPGAALELTLGGKAVVPLLQAVSGDRIRLGGRTRRITTPAVEKLTVGVATGEQAHVLTLTRTGGQTMVTDSAALVRAVEAGEIRMGAAAGARGAAAPATAFRQPGVTARLLTGLRPAQLDRLGTVTDAHAGTALSRALDRLGISSLKAADVAHVLGGGRPGQHLLRFTLTDKGGALIGGYSVIVT